MEAIKTRVLQKLQEVEDPPEAVLPSARICPYFYGNSTCNPQYGNAVVDSANLKKSKPISKSFNLKQVSVSN